MEDDVHDPYEYEVDLRDYIKVIWNEKWIIILVFVISIGAALAFSLTSTPKYQSKATVLITSSLSQQLVTGSLESSFVNFASEFDYKEIGLSDQLLESLESELDSITDSSEQPSTDTLRKRMSVKLRRPEESEKDNEEDSETETNEPVINLSVTGSNRERIEEIINKWAELYINRASEVLSGEIERYHDLISARHSEIKKELEAKIEERIEVRKKQNLGILEIRNEALKENYSGFLSSLDTKRLDLKKKRTKLRTLNNTLKDVPRYIYLERSVPSKENEDNQSNDPQKTTEGNTSSFPVRVKDQEVNEVFLDLTKKEIDLNLEIASLEREVSYLESRIGEMGEEISKNRAKLERGQSKLEILDRAIMDLESTSYYLYSILKNARSIKGEDVKHLKLGQTSPETTTLSSVNTKQNVAVAGVLGLFIGVLIAFFKNYMEGYEEEA